VLVHGGQRVVEEDMEEVVAHLVVELEVVDAHIF
jgi:hypothetical protein